MLVEFKRVRPEAKFPAYATPGSAAMDIFICGNYIIEPQTVVKVKTGWKVAVPQGWFLDIRPRSGVSIRYPFLKIVNAPVVIDSDYRGEVFLLFQNIASVGDIELKHGWRMAQMLMLECPRPIRVINLEGDQELSATDRGEGGLGSTGME